VEGISGEYRVSVRATTVQPSRDPDAVLICVKANQTQTVAVTLREWLPDRTPVISLQNGLGNVEILEEHLGRERVLGGVTAEGATLLAVGHVRHAGQGDTIVGGGDLPESTLKEIVSAFQGAGFQTRTTQDTASVVWGKLVINVGINALTAITRLKNGRLPEVQGTKTILDLAVREAVAVAEAQGISLPYPDPLERVLSVCRATSGNIASMLQDVLNHRSTEVAFINGAIVQQGDRLGIPTPVNRTLTCLVQAIQETYGDRI
jgi:2-dehydropantoate 2-reductase